MKTIIFIGYFLAQCVDKESDGKFNILFEYLDSSKGRAHPMIAHWESKSFFKPKTIYNLKVEAECTPTFDLKEGNGKSGSSWSPEDDWIYNGASYACNAFDVKVLSNDTLVPCDLYSRFCNICE